MRIVIAYPPLNSDRGVPLLSQNRQFQYFKEPTYIYPVVPAYAATMLKNAGHEVYWLDGIAGELSDADFLERIKQIQPDVVALETKTPVVKQHWKIIDDLKKLVTGDWCPVAVLYGDHVTALPEESFQNSSVDFVLTGGDYDFLLLNLCNVLTNTTNSTNKLFPSLSLPARGREKTVSFSSTRGKGELYPSPTLGGGKGGGTPESKLEPGIWYRENGAVKSTGVFKLDHDLNTLPVIDRDLTQWKNYAFKNGNFKQTPGAYIMSGRDCWWGKCKFCSWPSLYPAFRARRPGQVLDEIDFLAGAHGAKEIMDDTGTFPAGDWLAEFCEGMVKRGLARRVFLDCNMRFGALNRGQYAQMKKAGFRLMLFGLESANQKTLDRLNKGVRVEEIITSCRQARRAGLYPHITIMFGYPWETQAEAKKTLELGCWLLKKGLAWTVQATIVIPYPGSELFSECRSQNLLASQDWDDYDMKRPVIRTPIEEGVLMGFVQGIYKTAFDPEFILRRLFSIRKVSDIRYFKRGMAKVLGHIFDFKNNKN